MTEQLKQAEPTAQELERAAKMCDGFAAPEMAAALRGQPAQAGEVDERVAFINWMTTTYPKVYREADASAYWENGHVSSLAWQARASLPTQPAAQATPEPVTWAPLKRSADGRAAVLKFFMFKLKRHDFLDYITNTLAADFACVLGGYLQATATPPQQAAGEPVGEPAVTITFGDTGMVRNLIIHNESIKGQRLDLFTHPAPGVPEGWSTHTDAHGSGKYWLRDAKGTLIARDMSKATAETLASVLAAAQAKGGEHA